MRFVLRLLLAAAFLSCLLLSLLYGPVPYATFRAQFWLANHQSTLAMLQDPVLLTPVRYAALRLAAGLGLLLSGTAWWATGRRKRRNGRPGSPLGRELRAASQVLRDWWRDLSPGERAVVLALLLAIGAVRTWFLLRYPFNVDESATYDFFVRCGPRVAASFYPVPNNHVLNSLLSWPLVQALGTQVDGDLLVRLPTYGLSLLSMALAYAVLARLTSLRLATLATGLFQLTPMAAQYAVAARGYGLQVAAIQALFLAGLVLWRGRGFQRLAYAVFVGASLAGFYLIPTFLYPFLSLTTPLFLALVLGGRRPAAGRLVVAGAGVGLLTVLLYLPVGLVSGWDALLHNRYVVALTAAEFWRRFGSYYLSGTISELWGQPALSIPALLALLGLGPLLAARWATPALRPVAALAWGGLLGPLPLLMMQQVYPPARTLHYILLFSFLLGAVLLETGLARWPSQSGRASQRAAALAWVVVLAAIAGYAAHRLHREAAVMRGGREQLALYQRHSNWLSARAPRRVLADVNLWELHFLYHYAYRQDRALPAIVAVGNQPLPADTGFDFLLLDPTMPLPDWATARRPRVVAEDEQLRLYELLSPPPARP